MLAKISTILYLIAAVLHFINGQMVIFVLSIVLGIVTLGLSEYIRYLPVSPLLREYRETVYKIEADRSSDNEISEFMDQETELDESKLIDAPLWMNMVVALGIVASFILFGIGVMGRVQMTSQNGHRFKKETALIGTTFEVSYVNMHKFFWKESITNNLPIKNKTWVEDL